MRIISEQCSRGFGVGSNGSPQQPAITLMLGNSFITIWQLSPLQNKSSHLPSIDTLLRNSSYIFLFLKVLPYKKKKSKFSFCLTFYMRLQIKLKTKINFTRHTTSCLTDPKPTRFSVFKFNYFSNISEFNGHKVLGIYCSLDVSKVCLNCITSKSPLLLTFIRTVPHALY